MIPGGSDRRNPCNDGRVRFEVEEKIDLVGGRLAPPFKFVEDIECEEHSISIWGDLEGAYIKIVCDPSGIMM